MKMNKRIRHSMPYAFLLMVSLPATAFMPFMGGEGAANNNPVQLTLHCSDAVWKKDGSTSVNCKAESYNRSSQEEVGEFRIAPVAINGRIDFENIQLVDKQSEQPHTFLVYPEIKLQAGKKKVWEVDLHLPEGSKRESVGIQLISLFTPKVDKNRISSAFHLVHAP
ncbi:MAG: hypothetical protein HN842_05690 [Gammaproteobacteria bacterium]|nr:hypothetical protein [Gammaproteobacteria bacterium]